MEERDSPLQRKFRFLLIHIGNELHTKNCKALKFAHKINLSKKECDEEGLDILSELMQKGVFDAYHPDGLKSILHMIGRKDLSNEIDHYQNSSLFKKEMKRRLVQRTREHFLHSNSSNAEWTHDNPEKFMSIATKLLSHMSAMVEQTVALTSNVETLVRDETSRPQVLESISTTKAKMGDVSKAIQEMVQEVEHAQCSDPDDVFQRTISLTGKIILITITLPVIINNLVLV